MERGGAKWRNTKGIHGVGVRAGGKQRQGEWCIVLGKSPVKGSVVDGASPGGQEGPNQKEPGEPRRARLCGGGSGPLEGAGGAGVRRGWKA